MSEPTTDAAVRATVGRKLIRNPLLWGALLLLGAIVATLAGDDLSFFPMLLMLVGGWFFGFAFVNATLRMTPSRNGAYLHIGVAVVLGAAVAFVVEYGSELLEPLPEWVSGVAVVLQIAAIPATGWIWLGLLSRVTDALTRRERRKHPLPTTVEWEREESGDGSSVRINGIPLRMKVLTGAIVGIVIVFGLFGTLLLIAFDDFVMRLGPRLMIIVVGALIALPVYLALTAVLRRRMVACVIAFGNDELRVRVGEAEHVVPFRDLEFLLWRSRSDYARIEVRGAGVDLSVVAGLAKPPAGRTAELPVLPRRVFRRLELAGLSVKRARRGDVITFTRP